ncbi:hypothetical protein [Desulfovibrio subterraneus]|uniref:Uncharacterized protein n=1 Tax=Desulfovibrio subterraneus TaxID=2718620 RepID=A0A7J0BDJ7_9BACT|nr:hypothetical protein [Desulfovibrio subterraneus]GFM31726.1 hypothetical protein DSM101010T_00910 [Desulfovibrio subterraneus]
MVQATSSVNDVAFRKRFVLACVYVVYRIDANSKVRSERCGRLTADVAMKAIEIMNAKIDGTFKGAFAKQDSVAYCGDCHGKGKESPLLKGKQDCTPCHSGTDHTQNKFKNHP